MAQGCIDAISFHGWNGNASSGVVCDVAICGGGLGGLALAAGLSLRGYDVHVFEAAPELRTSTGTLIGLGGNAFTALEELHPDIVPQLKARASLVTTIKRVTRLNKDAEAETVSMPAFVENYNMCWSAVQDVLAGLIPPEAVHCGWRVVRYTEAEDGGPVRLQFRGRPDVVARFVVGADGLRSAIRATMVPNDPGPRYLGHMNWNAVIHNPEGSVVDAHKPGELQVHADQPFASEQQFTITSYLTDAGSGYTFWQIRIESDTPAFTLAPALSFDGDNRPSPGFAWAGLGKAGSKARLEKELADGGFDHMVKVVQATPESAIFERAMMDRVPLDELGATMSSRGGRVVLMGDAAHAMHAGPGQGGRTAFEDAHTLMLLLEQHRKHLVDWVPAPGQKAARPAATPPESKDSGRQRAETHTGQSLQEMLVEPEKQLNELRTSISSLPRLEADPAIQNKDLPALSMIMAGYNDTRLARTCRIQRMAVEGCGLQTLRDAVKPRGLTPEERKARGMEFFKWLNQYPANPTGDPDSKFYKPVQREYKPEESLLCLTISE